MHLHVHERLSGPSAVPEQAATQHYLAQHEPQHNALLRTGVAPTILSGGFRRNVIPSQAEAMLDVRALPDENPEEFNAHMAAVINNPNVEVVPQPIYRPKEQGCNSTH